MFRTAGSHEKKHWAVAGIETRPLDVESVALTTKPQRTLNQCANSIER